MMAFVFLKKPGGKRGGGGTSASAPARIISSTFRRRRGEALQPDREPLETLEPIRRTIGPYNFAGQYQQSPAPLGGGQIENRKPLPARPF